MTKANTPDRMQSLAAVPASAELGRYSLSSLERMLGILELFTLENPEWTVEQAAPLLGVSLSQTYRYFRILTNAGFLDATTAAGFSLGPAFAAYDRQIQLSDPLLIAARPVMQELVQFGPSSATMFLTRIYHDRAICVERIMRGSGAGITYERGRLISLFRGATTKVILANLPLRVSKRIYEVQHREAAHAGLGSTWEEFRAAMRVIRRQGFCIASGEVDVGRFAVAAPIFGPSRAVLGGLGFVIAEEDVSEGLVRRLTTLVVDATHEIGNAIGASIARAVS